ncbi:MAG: hypothetical protein WBD37_11480 [Anderseniella sp.]
MDQFVTRTRINQLLAGAKAVGDLGKLYWYIDCKMPASKTGLKKAIIAAAQYPGDMVPLIPVGSDPAVSEQEAIILLKCFRLANAGRGLEFALNLTAESIRNVCQSYVWGETLFDCICRDCGTVFPFTVAEALCGDCRRRRLLWAQRELPEPSSLLTPVST